MGSLWRCLPAPADFVTCGDLDGLTVSDRDYGQALLRSGTQRALQDLRIYLHTREEREQQLAATLDKMARRELKASGGKGTAR